MKSKTLKIFTISILVILFFAGLYFLSSILIEMSNGSKLASSRFDDLTKQIDITLEETSFLSEDFYNLSKNVIRNNEYVNAVTFQLDSIVFFAFPTTSNLIKADSEGNPLISSSSTIIKIFTKSIPVSSSSTMTITAAINTILPTKIFSIARNSFVIILTCTLIVLIVIAYLCFFETKKHKNDEEVEELDNIEEVENISEISDKNYINEYEEPISESDHEDSAFECSPIQEEHESIELDTPIIEEDEEFISDDNYSANEEFISDDPQNDSFSSANLLSEKNDPMGLFSNKTGFGWESYLETRLDAELIRAASSEQDLTLFIIKTDELERTTSAGQEVCASLLNFFKFRDMIFEYGEFDYAGLILNMDIENAMNVVEKLYINLKQVLTKYDLPNKIGIGITTRTLRLVPGERLIDEANQAATKAITEEDLPIVAFKVNHEKYRKFLVEEASKDITE